jgi:putative FmdB family regulatory protein
MPIYEYECGKCSHRFEKRQGFNDVSIVDCPKCSAKSKRILCPAPVLFKGSGFYVTDSGKNPANS